MARKIKLLIIEHDQPTRQALLRLLPNEAFVITEAEGFAEGQQALRSKAFDLVLLDLSLPDGDGLELVRTFSEDYKNRIIVLTGTASVQSAVEAMKSGVFDFLEKPVCPERLITTLQKAAELMREILDYRELRKEFSSNPTFEKLIYESKVMADLIQKAKRIARTENNVLIQGETGTGKELFAHSLHNYSRRGGHPFISINCASVPESLAESELFGFEKGAFTGAGTPYPGKFRLGHNGTVFLDEVAELPAVVQGKLLRTLDSGEVSPLKSTRPVSVDVRVIAATNRKIDEEIKLKRFREDLFYRIAEVKIEIPPLREHREDILPLACHFLKIANITNSTGIERIEPEAERLLRIYHWPGNVRELKNVISEMSALISGSVIKAGHLPSRVVKQQPGRARNGRQEISLKELERRHILRVLKSTGYHYPQAIKLLGISRATLYRKLHEYHIDPLKNPDGYP